MADPTAAELRAKKRAVLQADSGEWVVIRDGRIVFDGARPRYYKTEAEARDAAGLTTEQEATVPTTTNPTKTFPDGRTLPLDLDGDPYVIDETLGAWKMTPCCGAAATGTDDGIACKSCYELVLNDGPARLSDEDQRMVALEIAQAKQLADYEEEYGAGPTPLDYYPVGSRVVVQHAFSDREIARGRVTGHTTGLYDFGGPESGPGPVEEADMLTVACDDGEERSVYIGNVESETACPKCGSEDLARFGSTQERTDADMTDHVECQSCGWKGGRS